MFQLKFESSGWSWKVTYEIGNFKLNLERLNENGKIPFKLQRFVPTSARTFQLQRNFPALVGSFQFRWDFPNFAQFFSTSLGSFQLKQKVSNFRLSNLKLSNSLFFLTYPVQAVMKLKPWLPGLIELYFKFWNNLCTSSWFAVGVAAVDIANKGKSATWFGELSSDFSFDGRFEVLPLTVNTSSVILPACFITGRGDGTTVRNFAWPLSDESRFSAS